MTSSFEQGSKPIYLHLIAPIFESLDRPFELTFSLFFELTEATLWLVTTSFQSTPRLLRFLPRFVRQRLLRNPESNTSTAHDDSNSVVLPTPAPSSAADVPLTPRSLAQSVVSEARKVYEEIRASASAPRPLTRDGAGAIGMRDKRLRTRKMILEQESRRREEINHVEKVAIGLMPEDQQGPAPSLVPRMAPNTIPAAQPKPFKPSSVTLRAQVATQQLQRTAPQGLSNVHSSHLPTSLPIISSPLSRTRPEHPSIAADIVPSTSTTNSAFLTDMLPSPRLSRLAESMAAAQSPHQTSSRSATDVPTTSSLLPITTHYQPLAHVQPDSPSVATLPHYSQRHSPLIGRPDTPNSHRRTSGTVLSPVSHPTSLPPTPMPPGSFTTRPDNLTMSSNKRKPSHSPSKVSGVSDDSDDRSATPPLVDSPPRRSLRATPARKAKSNANLALSAKKKRGVDPSKTSVEGRKRVKLDLEPSEGSDEKEELGETPTAMQEDHIPQADVKFQPQSSSSQPKSPVVASSVESSILPVRRTRARISTAPKHVVPDSNRPAVASKTRSSVSSAALDSLRPIHTGIKGPAAKVSGPSRAVGVPATSKGVTASIPRPSTRAMRDRKGVVATAAAAIETASAVDLGEEDGAKARVGRTALGSGPLRGRGRGRGK